MPSKVDMVAAMTSAGPRADRALAQLDVLTRALGLVVAGLMLVTITATVVGTGSVLGFGDREVCAPARPGEVPWGGEEPRRAVPGLADDARWHTAELAVCVEDPDPGLRLAASLGGLSELAIFVGSLVLVRRVIRHARRSGLFAEGVAARVRILGRFLVVAAPVSAFLARLGDHLVLDAAVAGELWYTHLLSWDFPWTVFIVGVGLVSTAKVMAYAGELQDDVDRTI
jgi:hypothetical protein